MLVAVYGTLRRGMENHHMLRRASLLWEGFVRIPYKLVVCGDTPYLVKSNDVNRIYIEVYEVDEELLRELDDFENVPLEYRRVEIETPVGRAWIYVASRDVECVEVPEGDYALFIKRTRSS